MQRTKQQALLFLLGAVLVGGVLGFSANRVLDSKSKGEGSWFHREGMYDDLALTPDQRAQIDSVLDIRNCQMRALMDPLKPQADSIRAAGQEQMRLILTPAQRERFERRRTEIDARRKAERESHGPRRSTATCK
ncbi:MAG: hypothetical protein H0X64_13640 [Gemmatimonadaceae bacterium]|nr:hypothetical protein [Gemmatimonadaceae bacterium]